MELAENRQHDSQTVTVYRISEEVHYVSAYDSFLMVLNVF